MVLNMPSTGFAVQQTIDMNGLTDWDAVTNYMTDSLTDAGGGGYDLTKFYITNDASYLYFRWDIQLSGNQTDLKQTNLGVALSSSTDGSTADGMVWILFKNDGSVDPNSSVKRLTGTAKSTPIEPADIKKFNIGIQNALISVVARIPFASFDSVDLGDIVNATKVFPLWCQTNASNQPTSSAKDRIPDAGHFTYDAANGTAVIIGSAASSAKDILTFEVPGQIGSSVINSTNGTIGITVSSDTSVNNLAATFTLSEKTKGAAVDGVLQTSGITQNDFTSPVTYAVMAEDGTIKGWNVTVSVQGEAEPPGIDGLSDKTINEDQTFTFQTTISVAAPPVLSVSALSSDKGILNDPIVANDNGTLTITLNPVKDQFGEAAVIVTVTDSEDNSTEGTFNVTINPVNDAPSFVAGPDQVVSINSGVQSVPGWAAGISMGADNETHQVLNFIVNTDNDGLFSVLPSIDPATGNLTYTPAPDANGSAAVTVKLHDDGGTGNGGQDTSDAQTFTITVKDANQRPVNTAAPAISGTMLVGEVITSDVGTWSDDETLSDEITYAFQWQSSVDNTENSFADITGAASDTFTITTNEAHKYIRVRVTATDGGKGSLAPESSAAYSGSSFVGNAAPRIFEDSPQVLTVNEDNSGSIKLTASDADCDTLTWSIGSQASHGTASVDGTGNVIYTPAANYNGSDSFTVKVGDGNGGEDTITVDVTVNPVNDAPAFDMLEIPQIVPEDSGTHSVDNWIANKAPGPSADEASQTLALTVTNDNSQLFSSQPAVDDNGTLTYTLKPDANGSAVVTVKLEDDGGTENGGIDAVIRTFTITVTAVNDVPSFTKGTDVTVSEDEGPQIAAGWAADISKGPPNESEQTLTFVVSSNNSSLFSVQPSINPATGNLTFTPAADANGHAEVTVTLMDDGGTASGGQDTSASQTFKITVLAVNDAPSFTKGADVTILEDMGAQTINNWATGISKGPSDESDQELAFDVSSSDPSMFIVQPSISSSGTLTYTPAPNAYGTALITVKAMDFGGSKGAEESVSPEQTFSIAITGINDIPSFTKGGNITVSEDCGFYTTEWAQNISKGAENEFGQTLAFVVTNNNTSLFSVQPAVDPVTGNLTFTPNDNASGKATVTVYLKDDGGTDNGGKDETAPVAFTITINPVNDAPTIESISDKEINEDGDTLIVPFKVNDVDNDESLLTITAIVTSTDNEKLFPVSNIIIKGSGTDRSISLTPAANQSGTASITVTVSDGSSQAVTAFDITVNSVNDLPVISSIADQTINEDTSTGNISFTVGDVETAATDLIVTFTSDNITLFPEGRITLGGTGDKRYINLSPAANESGTSKVTVAVRDADGGISEIEFDITVNPVNDLPLLYLPADQEIDEDTSTGELAITVSDVETSNADDLVVTAVSGNQNIISNGGIVLTGSGDTRTIKVTPLKDASGEVVVSVTAKDKGNGETTKSFIVNVKAVNDGPAIGEVADFEMQEDTQSQEIYFTVGDVDNNVQDLVVTAVSSNISLISSESIVLGGTGADRYIKLKPVYNQFGTADITLTVSDGSLTSSTAFTVTVTNVNDAPEIGHIGNQEMSETVGTDSTIEIPFWVDDIDDSLNSLILTPQFDTDLFSLVEFDGSGSSRKIRVTSKNTTGTGTIRVTVSDPGSLSNYREFIVNIAAGGGGESIISHIVNHSTPEDTESGFIYFSVLSQYGDNVTVSSNNPDVIPNDGSHIILERNASGDTDTRKQWKVNLIPLPNANGDVSLTVTAVLDGEGGPTEAKRNFILYVEPVNDTPVIGGSDFIAVDEDTPVPANTITISDVDAGDILRVSVVSSDQVLFPSANISVTPTDTGKTIALTPADNKNGSTIITVWVTDNDGQGLTVFKSFHVAVNPVNDVPTISNIEDQTINEDTTSAPIPFEVDDVELTAGNLIVSAVSSNEDLISNNGISFGGSGKNRTLTITPMPNKYTNTGEKVTITVKVSDGEAEVTDTFDVTINPVNDSPNIGFIANQTIYEDASIGPISFSIGDIDSDIGSLTVEASSNNESLIPADKIVLGGSGASRTITLTPLPNMSGIAVITIKVTDDEGAASTRTFILNVTAVNDAPLVYRADDDTKTAPLPDVTIDEDSSADEISINIEDVETSTNLLTVEVTSGNETILPKDNINLVRVGETNTYTLSLTPAPNQNGIVIVTFKVSDGSATTVKSFRLNVTPVNDPPTISDIADLSIDEDTSTGIISFIVGDIEKAAGSLVVTASSDNAALVPGTNIILGGTGANRTIKLIPLADQFGNTTITVNVSDGDITTADTFVLTVRPVNDTPSFIKGGDRTVLEDAPAQTVTGWATNISKGPSNESDQTLEFVVTNDNNGLFSVQPAVSADGTLTFTPAPDAFGTALVTVKAKDYGGAADAPEAASSEQTFNITVTSVNDVPVFTKGADQTVNEDAEAQTVTGWATGISKGPSNESNQTLNFIVSTNNNGLFNVLPAINSTTGNLTYTLKEDANGTAVVTVRLQDNGGTANGGTNTSAAQTFIISVTSVNDAPVFDKGADQTVDEDAGAQTVIGWATGIKKGADNETHQVLNFIVTTDNDDLFSAKPSIDPATGNLTYTPAADANGSAAVTVKLHDDGGTDNGGADTSTEQTFTITVRSVNDAPSFDMLTVPQELLEDAAPQSISGWVTNKTPGIHENEAAQKLTMTVTNNNNGLFISQPSIDDSGTLTYTLAPNANGIATVTVKLQDDGGTAYGGTDTAAKTFVITVKSVNDAPVFTKGTDITIPEDSPAQSVPGWATGISTGAANEAQELTFTVENNNNGMFIMQPAIDASGKLTYSVKPDANGTATVTVKLKDNGGTVDGGQDTSPEQTFTITVTAVNDAPVNTAPPEFTGAMKVGETLTAHAGAWNDDIDVIPGTITYAYQWQVADDISGINTGDILGATEDTHTITSNEAHKYIRLKVTAADDGEGEPASQSTVAYSSWLLVDNTVPVIAEGASKELSLDEDTIISFELNASDMDGDALTWSIGSEASHGTAVITGEGNCRSITYTPAANYNGSDSFTVKVSDGKGGEVDCVVAVTVKPVNDVPVNTVSPTFAGIMKVGQQLTASVGTWNDDRDIIPGAITYAYQWQVADDNLGTNAADISGATSNTYTLTTNEAHKYIRLQIIASDNGEGNPVSQSTTAYSSWFLVSNTAPVIAEGVGKHIDMDVNGNIDFSLNSTDADGDELTWSISSYANHGEVSITGSGSSCEISYIPEERYLGNDSFTIKVVDSRGGEASVNVTINVADRTKPVINLNGSSNIVLEVDGIYTEKATAIDNYGGDITDSIVTVSNLDINTVGVYTITYDVMDAAGNSAEQMTRTIHVIRQTTLQGKITEKDTGKEIVNAKVTLKTLDGKLIDETATDDNGDYIFNSVTLGNYMLVAENPKYSTRTVEINVVPKNLTGLNMVKDLTMVNFKITLDSNPKSLIGDGVQTSMLTATIVDKDNEPISGIQVNFSAEMGSFPEGSTAVTDEYGKCSVPYKSQMIEGIKSVITIVKAEVNDNIRDLHAYSEIVVTFDPSSIEGIVLDNDTGLPVEGAIVEVSRDFDGDGVIDFYAKMVTGPDGKYKVAVPRGEVEYDLKITKPVRIGDSISSVTFTQSCTTGKITGTGAETFNADNSIAGLVLSKQPDGSTKLLEDYSNFSIEVMDNQDKTSFTRPLKNSNTEKGIFLAEGLEKDKTYRVSVTYSLGNGEKLVVGTAEVTVNSDGQTSISTILIDPYGVITDESSKNPISGVKVTLKYADTKRNKDKGITPDTQVNLPLIAGFAPSDNANPQDSNSQGEYAFMVFPDTDYYITASKAGYQNYVSPTISVNDKIVQFNFSMRREYSGGGSQDISDSMGTAISRLSGQQRVDTAIAIAKATFAGKVKNVIIATSQNFPDALAGSVLAYKLEAPIVLVSSYNVDQEKVLSYIKEYMNSSGTVYILGGTGAVNAEMEKKVKTAGFNVKRLGGIDRYETAMKIVEELDVKEGTPIVIASGENYPDALSISSIAAIKQYPIFLARKDSLDDCVKDKIAELKPGKVFIIGLQGAVSNEVQNLVSSIASLDKSNVVRIGGIDRYETSIEVAKYFNLSSKSICAATGNNFPDIIAGSVYAAFNNSPVILVDKSVPDSLRAYINDRRIIKATIFGGEGAVSKSVEEEFSQIILEITSKK